MMGQLKKKLDLFGYKYYMPDENTIKIFLTESLVVTVTHKNNQWQIREKFEKINFVSAFLKLGFMPLLVINILFLIAFSVLIILLPMDGIIKPIIIVLMITSAWSTFYYYYIKFIHFKSLLIQWLSNIK